MTSHEMVETLTSSGIQARRVDHAVALWQYRQRLLPAQRDLLGLVTCKLSQGKFEPFPRVVRLTEVRGEHMARCTACGERTEVVGTKTTVVLVRGSDGQYVAVRAE